MAWTQEKVQTLLESVVKKAQEDVLFREKLKSNTREVLEAQSDEEIPENFRITLLDLNEIDIVITLPKSQLEELNDSDLEHVVGGKDPRRPKKIVTQEGEEYLRRKKN